ncbi:SPL family radical SAM protein [[Clostridium] fimetarium]|uniref:DNA repair photolyase n=1 Tax=[Clostridium] fimetarium TaxID=99656 RepID=A0A1I0RKE8_9FIRM|nr:radical SAM protein [[Clostridium] fimetarium]SEW41456.1 DNA repair photolyase [[Clostridium] fimetarium]
MINAIQAKSIMQKKNNGDKWFGTDYNMNLYKGCCHGCIYCDSRSDCYHIDNFDSVRLKENCINILEQDLRSKRNTGVVGIGAMSDTYNPFEKQYEITRDSLKLLAQYGFGTSIDTKSSLVKRDIDILKKIAEHNSCIVKLTITTADDELCKIIEPNVCVSSKRFEAIRELASNGIFTGVLLMPILPYINNTEENIKTIINKAAEAGAKFVYAMFGVTLRENQRDYYYQKLDEHFPGMKKKYIEKYGVSYTCTSDNAKELYEMYVSECKRLGLLYKMEDIIEAYKGANSYEQISLF